MSYGIDVWGDFVVGHNTTRVGRYIRPVEGNGIADFVIEGLWLLGLGGRCYGGGDVIHLKILSFVGIGAPSEVISRYWVE